MGPLLNQARADMERATRKVEPALHAYNEKGKTFNEAEAR
jgi:hypothetical protein